jgi:hypothetical protein
MAMILTAAGVSAVSFPEGSILGRSRARCGANPDFGSQYQLIARQSRERVREITFSISAHPGRPAGLILSGDPPASSVPGRRPGSVRWGSGAGHLLRAQVMADHFGGQVGVGRRVGRSVVHRSGTPDPVGRIAGALVAG